MHSNCSFSIIYAHKNYIFIKILFNLYFNNKRYVFKAKNLIHSSNVHRRREIFIQTFIYIYFLIIKYIIIILVTHQDAFVAIVYA